MKLMNGCSKFLIEDSGEATLSIPIFVNDFFWGFVGFDEFTKEKEWTEENFLYSSLLPRH